ncbi:MULTISPECIES: hypothetical protein [unclassified Bradyrhizobium]|uniref:hypothetical protein n=1 Tax=unclassified Bradyrhizobium TaxID=2631580 RepID=UPI0028ED57D5|nr:MULTISPECIES: hypothetical protein [unclassified Bradyrhizobium]
MACRCAERKQAIVAGAAALARGDLQATKAQAVFVARTLVQDARSGALRQAAAQQLARLKPGVRR